MQWESSAHALLSVFAANGIDRVFLVPGESYLGILDALNDFPQIDVVTCRIESGAGFMACADGRLARRPAVYMASRGPGATNASIALHTAQQDAIPLILVLGQVPKNNVRREAFQEINYQLMFGSIAKWVGEVTEPKELPEMAFKAMRMAMTGTPGPVVLVVPEDLQQQEVPQQHWLAPPLLPATPSAAACERLAALVQAAERPLIVAGSAFDPPGGREALLAFAEAWHIPVAVSFRRHDLFPNRHPLYVGDLGLANPADQMDVFHQSDLILALGTRLGDITSQGYTFPQLPKPKQTFVHCYPDARAIGLHFAADVGLACDPQQLVTALLPAGAADIPAIRRHWAARLRSIYEAIAAWPIRSVDDGVDFTEVVQALSRQAPADAIMCLDSGTFAAPVYRHFPFSYPQRLMAPQAGAMGCGIPAAVAAQLRYPGRKVISLVGDGGFLMTGNEIITAVERQLPVLAIVANNNSYGSIRVHQERYYPGRPPAGTTLSNPDFVRMAEAFGMPAELVRHTSQIEAALARGLAARTPYLIEVQASLKAILPAGGGD